MRNGKKKSLENLYMVPKMRKMRKIRTIMNTMLTMSSWSHTGKSFEKKKNRRSYYEQVTMSELVNCFLLCIPAIHDTVSHSFIITCVSFRYLSDEEARTDEEEDESMVSF